MITLEFAQTFFYIAMSFSALLFSIVLGLATFYLIKVGRSLEKISENVEQMSEGLNERLEEVLELFSTLPILSFFFKKSKKNRIKHKISKSR